MKNNKIITLAVLLTLGVPYTSFASIDKNLKYGQRDNEVMELQEFLIDKGFLKTIPSTYFGLLTLKAVKAYQASIGVSSTGFVGALTREKINKEIDAEVATSNSAEKSETSTNTVPAPVVQIQSTTYTPPAVVTTQPQPTYTYTASVVTPPVKTDPIVYVSPVNSRVDMTQKYVGGMVQTYKAIADFELRNTSNDMVEVNAISFKSLPNGFSTNSSDVISVGEINKNATERPLSVGWGAVATVPLDYPVRIFGGSATTIRIQYVVPPFNNMESGFSLGFSLEGITTTDKTEFKTFPVQNVAKYK
jgi:peptidoglycan hydrolase-like protein with peptidoglycan-binding domain